MNNNNLINSKKLWFTSKRYGWGWTPVTKEGWLVVLSYIVFVLFHATINSMDPYNQLVRIAYVFDLVISTIVLFIVCYKTGEKPRWRWGK